MVSSQLLLRNRSRRCIFQLRQQHCKKHRAAKVSDHKDIIMAFGTYVTQTPTQANVSGCFCRAMNDQYSAGGHTADILPKKPSAGCV